MSLLRKIKRFLGLELPHLLEDEEEVTDVNNKSIVKSTRGINSPSRSMNNIGDEFRKLSEVVAMGGITMNEAREIAKKMSDVYRR